MAVDKAVLSRMIADVAGNDAELTALLNEKFGTNEDVATRFVGGFMRTADYTQKTQALSQEKATLTEQYESRLSESDKKIDKIMRDLAGERVTAAKAQSLLNSVKEAYQLTDEDLPGIDDIKKTAATGKVVDSTPDFDTRLASFKTELMKELTDKLVPELGSLAALPAVWNEIGYEHQQLFGKRLTKKEQTDLLADARKENKSLETVWTEKYGVPDKRLELRDTENKKTWQKEWEDEQARKNQELAMRGVRPGSDEEFMESLQSPLFKKNLQPIDEKTGERGKMPDNTPPPDQRLRGADAAAAKFLEKSRNGTLGKAVERKTA